MLKPPFKDESFQTIFCIAALEHIFYLEAFIQSIERILAKEGDFYVLIPTQGGLTWSLLQNLSALKFSKQLDINYKKVIEKEHCNNAITVENALHKYFIVDHSRTVPFRTGGYNFNLVKLFRLKKR